MIVLRLFIYQHTHLCPIYKLYSVKLKKFPFIFWQIVNLSKKCSVFEITLKEWIHKFQFPLFFRFSMLHVLPYVQQLFLPHLTVHELKSKMKKGERDPNLISRYEQRVWMKSTWRSTEIIDTFTWSSMIDRFLARKNNDAVLEMAVDILLSSTTRLGTVRTARMNDDEACNKGWCRGIIGSYDCPRRA